MPKAGDRLTRCRRGHDLTLPGARCKPGPNRRGGGSCRLCEVDSKRRYNKSSKSGPPERARWKADHASRLAAVEQGRKHCPRCGEDKDPDQFRQSTKSPDGCHSYCKSCSSAWERKRWVRDGQDVNLRRRAAKYGITVEELISLDERYGGLCAICQRTCPSGRSLAVDHDHRTGRVRGLLCANCNRGIGLLMDSAATAQAAADYLRHWESCA